METPTRAKRMKRNPGDPRFCRFTMPNGKPHGIELTDENSYKTSTYCKEHHALRAEQSRLRRAAAAGRRQRRRPGEPRRCQFRLENGQLHGIELTDENSFKTSAYCREHHNVMKRRSLGQEPGRSGNIRRVTSYKERHREEVNRKRRELAHAKTVAAQRGISVEEARALLAQAQLPPPPHLIDRCFKATSARRWHVAGPGLIALCKNWRGAPGVELVSLPENHPELCQACRKAALAKTAKAAKR